MSPRVISEDEFQQRESELIALARRLVEKNCDTTLTIDRLVAESRFSKGTIYKHFLSKEDLLMAISNTCITEIQEIFSRSLKFNGNSREKIMAVLMSYIIWAKLHPSELFMVLSAHSPSVSARSSESKNENHIQLEKQLMGLMNQTILNAVKSGDVIFPDEMNLGQIAFSLWSSSWGAMALIMSKGNSKILDSLILEKSSLTNTQLILDGFNWKPLSKNWNYAKSIKVIGKEIFSKELDTLEKMGNPFIFV